MTTAQTTDRELLDNSKCQISGLWQDMPLIVAAHVARDEYGFWSHPGMPDFDEGDGEKYKAWKEAQGLEVKWDSLEGEDDSHPAYIEYYEQGGNNISEWKPDAPGPEWFTLWINDTEDGPVWVWARRVAVAAFGEQMP